MDRSEEHTSELQSRPHLVCRLLLEKKKRNVQLHGHGGQQSDQRCRGLHAGVVEFDGGGGRLWDQWCRVFSAVVVYWFFFFNDTATTEIYTLSLHDALPITPNNCGIGADEMNPAAKPATLL